MGRMKLDKPHKLALSVTVLLILLCMSMLVGTAWARYRYRQTTDMLFAPKTASQIYLWGNSAASGTYKPLPEDLTQSAQGNTLDFVVSNGETADKFATDDQYALVRLYGSLGLGAGENLTATLRVDGVTYTAVARPVDVDSPVHTSFGEGWVYCFVDAEGNEPRWLLEGNALSEKQMQLTLNTRAGLDSSLLRLWVTSQSH